MDDISEPTAHGSGVRNLASFMRIETKLGYSTANGCSSVVIVSLTLIELKRSTDKCVNAVQISNCMFMLVKRHPFYLTDMNMNCFKSS
jgi:predicted metal-binding protein